LEDDLGYYRFLNAEHADRLVSGYFRFGNLMYYRLLELVYQDKWIGDRDEGQFRTVLDKGTIDGNDPASNTMRQRAHEMGIYVGQNAHVILENIQLISNFEGFVFCFSNGDLKTLQESMASRDSGLGSYDSCVEIADPEELLRLISDNGVDTKSGKHVSELFGKPSFDSVRYQDNSVSIHDSPALPASPFIKKVMYQAQREARIVLPLVAPLPQDHIEIYIDIPTNLLTKVELDNPIRVNPSTHSVIETKQSALIATMASLLRQTIGRDLKYPDIHLVWNKSISKEEYQRRHDSVEKIRQDRYINILFPSILNTYWKMRKYKIYPDLDTVLCDGPIPSRMMSLQVKLESYLDMLWHERAVPPSG